MAPIFSYGAVEGIRTPMVAHTDLNRARLPIPPRPLTEQSYYITTPSKKQEIFYSTFIPLSPSRL